MAIVLMFLGFILVGAAVYNTVTVINCSLRTEGVYRGFNGIASNKEVTWGTPIFKYSFENKEYEKPTTYETIKIKQLEKRFEVGKTYNIYVNPKKPEQIISERKLQPTDVVMMALGIGAFIIYYVLLST